MYLFLRLQTFHSQELHNKLEAEKANSYDLKDQLTRDITLQLQSQHVADKKKLTFDISILKVYLCRLKFQNLKLQNPNSLSLLAHSLHFKITSKIRCQ